MDCNSVDKNDIGFCSCFPCGVDEGPCTFDNECKDDLHCGYKNCPSSFDTNDNCCTKNDLLKSPNFPNPYPINVDHELVENLKVLNAFGRYCGLSGNNFIARVFFVHI